MKEETIFVYPRHTYLSLLFHRRIKKKFLTLFARAIRSIRLERSTCEAIAVSTIKPFVLSKLHVCNFAGVAGTLEIEQGWWVVDTDKRSAKERIEGDTIAYRAIFSVYVCVSGRDAEVSARRPYLYSSARSESFLSPGKPGFAHLNSHFHPEIFLKGTLRPSLWQR